MTDTMDLIVHWCVTTTMVCLTLGAVLLTAFGGCLLVRWIQEEWRHKP